MTEDVKQGVDDLIMLHVRTMKEIGAAAPKSNDVVNNIATLYALRQKDDAEEARHEEQKEKLAYDNGRADLELRAKEHQIATEGEKLELDRARLDFEREKFQCELAVKEETNEIERAKLNQVKFGQLIQAAIAATGTVFNGWLSLKVLHFEESGVVGSFVAKKVFGSMLGKQKTEM